MLGRSTPLIRRATSALSTAASSSAPSSARLLHLTPTLLTSSPTPKKPSITSISEIRRLIPGTSMLKAREALYATQNPSPGADDVSAALAWLEEDRRKSGAKKAEKVADRTNNEGLVGICLLSDGLPAGTEVVEGVLGGAHAAAPQGGLVELNCETDFVARNEVFVQLVNDVSHTAALFPTLAGVPPVSTSSSLSDLPLEAFLDFPLMPANPTAAPAGSGGKLRTVRSAIIDVVARLGEKVTLCRASTILLPPRGANVGAALPAKTIASAFAHGGGVAAPAQQQRPGQMMAAGKVVSLLLTRVQPPAAVASSSSTLTSTRGAVAPLRALTRSLARQAAGMETASIRAAAAEAADAAAVSSGAVPLYSQPFAMLLSSAGVQRSSEEESVQSVLARWWRGEGETAVEGEEAGSVDVVDMRRWKVGGSAPADATTVEAA